MYSMLDFFEKPPTITILDIGAALTETPPYNALIERGHAKLIGFEPDQAACKKLNETYGKSHQFLPYFVGDGHSAVFHETNWGPTGSLYEPNAELLNKFQNLSELVTLVARHPVQTVRLDDIHEIDSVDFVKIDVQGSELNVFKNAKRVLSKVLLIQTEVEFLELYKGQPMFSDVDNWLRGEGFQFHTFAGFGMRAFKPLVLDNDVNKGVRQLIWADALYVRDWMRLDLLSDDQLKKYAILTHDLIHSTDLAYLVLSELDRRHSSGLAEKYLSAMNNRSASGASPGK